MSLSLLKSGRAALIVLRSIPELIWALVFVRVVGLGPTAGVLAIALTYGGMLGKVYAEILESGEAHATQTGTGGHFRDQIHAIAHRLREEAHVVDQTGFVKRLDVIIQALGAISGPGLGGHQVPETGFVHGLRTGVADGDIGDGFPLEILGVQRACEREDGKRGQSGELAHATRHEE